MGTLNWLLIGLFFLLLIDLTNALTASAFSGYPSWPRMLEIGAVMGFVSASVGTFILNVPEVVYGLRGNRRYLALLGGPVFYGLVWVLPVRWMKNSSL